MKLIALLILVFMSLVVVGCSQQILADTPAHGKPLPPGTVPKDVLLPINK